MTSAAPASPRTAAPTWDEFHAGVRAFIRLLAGKLAHAFGLDADDCEQEFVFLLWRMFHTYDPAMGAPTTWVHWRYRGLMSIYRRQHRRLGRVVSLDALADEDSRPIDVPDPHAEPPHGPEARDDEVKLERVIRRLDKRERRIVRVRFGLEPGPATFQGLALEYGITKERVRQLEVRALRKLAGILGADPDDVVPSAKTATLRRNRREREQLVGATTGGESA